MTHAANRLSVFRTAASRRARLQVELAGVVVVVEMTAELARVVGGRLMMADPFYLAAGQLPLTEKGCVHLGVDGAVEVLGCRLEELAELDALAGADLGLRIILPHVHVEAHANAPSPSFSFLDDLQDNPAPGATRAVFLEQGRRPAAGEQIAGQPLAVGNAGLGASPACGEGVLIAAAIDVCAEGGFEVGPGGAEPTLVEREVGRGDTSTGRAAFVDDDRVSEVEVNAPLSGPHPTVTLDISHGSTVSKSGTGRKGSAR